MTRAKRSDARVRRTLLSVAFDFAIDFDVDVAFDPNLEFDREGHGFSSEPALSKRSAPKGAEKLPIKPTRPQPLRANGRIPQISPVIPSGA
jgi:hypothetical protein